jgi:hypothetical protein
LAATRIGCADGRIAAHARRGTAARAAFGVARAPRRSHRDGTVGLFVTIDAWYNATRSTANAATQCEWAQAPAAP